MSFNMHSFNNKRVIILYNALFCIYGLIENLQMVGSNFLPFDDKYDNYMFDSTRFEKYLFLVTSLSDIYSL